MSEDKSMKVVCDYAGALRTVTMVNTVSLVAQTVKNIPGVGKPFLAFTNLPANPVAAEFNHPSIVDENGNSKYVVSAVNAENAAMINEMLATPPLAAITLP